MRTREFVIGMLVGAMLLGLGMLLGGAARTARQPLDSMRLKQLEIIDDDGIVQLLLQSTPDGGLVRLNDRLGRPMAELGTDRSGGRIGINHAPGGPAVSIVAEEQGGAIRCLDGGGHAVFEAAGDEHGGRLRLAGVEGKELVRLSVAGRQHGTISCFDQYGTELLSLYGDVNGAGAIETYTADGERLVSISAATGHFGQLETYNGRGQVLARLGANSREAGQLVTFDATGPALITLGAHANGPSLRLLGASGKPIVTLESDDRDGGEIGIWRESGTGRVLRPE